MLGNLSIRKKILGGFGLTLALILLLAGVAVVGMTFANDVFSKYRGLSRSNDAAGDMETRILRAQIEVKNFVISNSDAAKQRVEQELAQAEQVSRRFIELTDDPQLGDLAAEQSRLLERYGAVFQDITMLQKDINEVVDGRLTIIGPRMRKRVTEALTQTYKDRDTKASYLAGLVQQHLILTRLHAQKFLINNDPEEAKRFDREAIILTQSLDAFMRSLDNPDRRQLAETIQTDVAAYLAAFESARTQIEERNALIEGQLNVVGPRIVEIVGEVNAIISAREDRLGPEATALFLSLKVVVVVAGGIGLVLGVVVALWLSRRISNPITKITAALQRLAENDYAIEIQGEGQGDEIGAMARSAQVLASRLEEAERLRQMRAETDQRVKVERERMLSELEEGLGGVVTAAVAGDFSKRVDCTFEDQVFNRLGDGINAVVDAVDRGLTETAAVLAALAKGDLTRKMSGDFKGAFARLRDNTNRTCEQLDRIMGDIQVSAAQVRRAVAEMNTATGDLARRTEQAASSLQETAAATEEVSSTVKQNAENAQHASDLALGANTVATKGESIVGQAIAAMSEIDGSSKKIAEIISVIDEIAFQTNLLALNASVEAARAGDAGKGFAVVAQEVRSLAQRAAQAAADIKHLIGASNNQVKGGVELVDSAGASLKQILSAIVDVGRTIEDIAKASQEQASGIQEISTSVSSVDEVTQQNASLVQENAATARSLGEQAERLSELTSFFKLSRSSAASTPAPGQPKVAEPDVRPRPGEPKARVAASAPTRCAQSHTSPTGTVARHNDSWAEF